MKKAIVTLVFFLLISIFVWLRLAGGKVSLGPGVFAPDEPVQVALPSPLVHQLGDYELSETHEFSLQAKVLSKKIYRFDEAADLAPVDLALGWGSMSDEAVLEDIRIWQAERFYLWKTRELPISKSEIDRSSANMHLIPFNVQIEKDLKAVREGEIVRLAGSLVNVRHLQEDWTWKTSRTRTDTGGGACEIIWVKKMEVVRSE